jgi:hypothetical protein
LPPGFVDDDPGSPAGFASGAPQYPQNTVPAGLSLPHCPHAGIWVTLAPSPNVSRKQ